MSEPIRVLLVNDYKIMRNGIGCLLASRSEMEILADVGDEAGTVRAVRNSHPDVYLVMSNGGLFERCLSTITLIRHEDPSARIVVLSNPISDEQTYALLRTGVLGFVHKDQSPDELFSAIHAVNRGKSSLNSYVVDKLIRNLKPQSRESEADEQLSERESQILKLVASGFPNKTIADKLSISERTVRTHVSNILGKLKLKNRTQAALFAIRKGMN